MRSLIATLYRLSVFPLLALVGCDGSQDQSPVSVTVKHRAIYAPNAALLDHSILTINGEGYCDDPSVRLGDIPLSPVFSTTNNVFIAGTPVLSRALDTLEPDWKKQCEWTFPTTLSLSCEGQTPIAPRGVDAVYAGAAASIRVTLSKTLLSASTWPAKTTEVSPWSTVAFRFAADSIDQRSIANSIRMDGVAGKVVSDVIDGRGQVTFVPDAPLAPDTSYTAVFSGSVHGPRNQLGGCVTFDGKDSTTITLHTRAASEPEFQLTGNLAPHVHHFEWDEIAGAEYEFAFSNMKEPMKLTTNAIDLETTYGDGCARVTAVIVGRRITTNELCTLDLK